MAQPISNHYMLTNGGSPQQATSYVVFSIDLVPDSYWPGLTLSGLVPEKPDGLVNCRL